MRRLLGIAAALFCALWVIAAPLAAQEELSADLERWSTLAQRAETAVDLGQGSEELFESLRASIADFRTQFNAARDLNANRIATLREQIAALGPPPEGENAPPEAPDVAAKREELNEQLNTLLVPVQKADAEYVRADALIAQIDQILRERQADRLLQVVPTPLNPVHWQQALTDLVQAAQLLWSGSPESDQAVSWEELRETLPLVLGLSLLGAVLILKGQAWSLLLVQQLQSLGARGIGIWRFLVSLLRIILPFAGLVLLALAAISTDLFGPKGDEVILTLAVLGGIMLGVRWVAERVFAKDEDEALILLPPEKRTLARVYVNLITVTLILSELVILVLEAGYPAEASIAALTFPFYLASSLVLFRIGMLLRGYHDPVNDEAALAEVRASTLSRVVRMLGSGAVAVACIAPLLLAAGYFNAAEALLPPYIMTLALLGLVMALQRFTADVYGAVTGQGVAAREALMPVLFGMLLLILVAPVLALIWGARLTDLTELWAAFSRGFAIGENRISPTDFLAFAVIFAIGYVLTRLIQSALRTNVLPKTRLDIGGQNAIVSGLGYVGIFLAALAAITGAGLDLSSLAIVAGALSVGIGFGLQNIVSNFVSGIILLIERPISEGDWIEVGGQMGYVRDISVRSTRIETFDRTDVIVPNADLVSGTVTNYTRGNTVGRLIVPVGVAYGSDTRKIERILTEVAESQPMVLTQPGPNILFLNFGADSLEFEIRCYLRDVNWMMVVKSDINHAIAERFAAEGIEVPFAQRDIWLRNPEVLHPTQRGEAAAAKTDNPEDRPEMRTPDPDPDPEGQT
jgi:small-conductance mechanosensitive channel